MKRKGDNMNIKSLAIAAGFTLKQAQFLDEHMAHVAEEIVGLDNTVAELVELNLPEEDDEEEGED